jgi:hypothetical protein
MGGRLVVLLSWAVGAAAHQPWSGGPTRRISEDFFHAWFDSNAALPLYRQRPDEACEATIAFLLEWPKHEINRRDRYDLTRQLHGFNFKADQLYPPFFTTGPFLGFLRANWRPAIGLTIRLVNFATERVFDWLIEDPERRCGLTFQTPHGAVFWRGDVQTFYRSRYHQHTAQVITCALMALEKWLEERLSAGEPVAEPVEMLFKDGRSLAFAGVLTSIGKRNPALFLEELKPLLFVREFYLCDQQMVANEPNIPNCWLFDPDLVNQQRREWNAPRERRQWLLDLCREWLLTRPEFEPVLAEVNATWRRQAEEMSAASETRLTLLRWAHSLDRSAWKAQ